MLVDSHAHLQFPQFESDLDGVIGRAADSGVSHIIVIGTDSDSSRQGVKLAERNGLSATVGFHPHAASNMNADGLKRLRELISSDAVVAVGEIGLDYYRDLSPRDAQVGAFRAQLGLAVECGLPVVIHDRDAHDEVATIIGEYADRLCGAVLHCYSGGIDLARGYIDFGFYFSVSGQLTYPGAEALRETILSIPIERLLLETDAPYLPPQPVRGKRNEPRFAVHTAQRLAELKGMRYDDICRITTSNVARLFGLVLQAEEEDSLSHGAG